MKTKLFLATCTIFAISQLVAQTEQSKCTLKGEFRNLPNIQQLTLEPHTKDWQMQIPIHDGKFEYVFNCSLEDMYTLRFVRKFDDWSQNLSFDFPFSVVLSEEGVVDLIFYPNPYDKNTMPRILFLPNSEQISKEDELHWESMTKMIEPLSDTINLINRQKRDGSLIPLDRMRALQKEDQRIWQMMVDLVLQYAKNHPSILTYNEIGHIITRDGLLTTDSQVKTAIEIFNTVYVPKYPNHFYTEMIKEYLQESK